MTRTAAALVVLALPPALAPAVQNPPPGAPVKALSLDRGEFNDLADLLRVVRRSGRVTLAADAPKGRLAVEFYRAGKRYPKTHAIGYDQSIVPGSYREILFAVQIADLDYLPLGSGPKGHVRVFLKVGPADRSLVASTTADVPKEVFDTGRGTGGAAFPAKVGTADEVPLFWLTAQTNVTKSGSTPAEVVEQNPDAQVAVFYLRTGDPK